MALLLVRGPADSTRAQTESGLLYAPPIRRVQRGPGRGGDQAAAPGCGIVSVREEGRWRALAGRWRRPGNVARHDPDIAEPRATEE